MKTLKILKDISFKERFSVIISLASVLMVGVGFIVMFFIFSNKIKEIVEDSKNNVYLMVDGHVVEAIRSKDYKSSVEASTKGFLALFHQYFWALEPYERYINENHAKAFDLGDYTIKNLRTYLNKKDFYNNMLAGKYSTRLEFDEKKDISIDFSSKPYKFEMKMKLLLMRQNDLVIYQLDTQGYIEERGSSSNNFTGYFIKDYKVETFEIIETKKYENAK